MGYIYTLTSGTIVLTAVNGVFSNVAPGTYSLVANNGTCKSVGTSIMVPSAPLSCVAQGCTLGYWKNHTDRWACYYTTTPYGSVFTSAPAELKSLTLLQVLNMGGGGIYNLGRQSVAALLSICNTAVAYNNEYPTTQSLIMAVNAAFDSHSAGIISSLGSKLDGYNNAGCPLGGTRATTAETSPSSSNSSSLVAVSSTKYLSIYPNPFSANATLTFRLESDQAYSLNIYDVQGRLVRRVSDGKASAFRTYQFEVGGGLEEGIYLVRLASGNHSESIRIAVQK